MNFDLTQFISILTSGMFLIIGSIVIWHWYKKHNILNFFKNNDYFKYQSSFLFFLFSLIAGIVFSSIADYTTDIGNDISSICDDKSSICDDKSFIYGFSDQGIRMGVLFRQNKKEASDLLIDLYNSDVLAISKSTETHKLLSQNKNANIKNNDNVLKELKQLYYTAYGVGSISSPFIARILHEYRVFYQLMLTLSLICAFLFIISLLLIFYKSFNSFELIIKDKFYYFSMPIVLLSLASVFLFTYRFEYTEYSKRVFGLYDSYIEFQLQKKTLDNKNSVRLTKKTISYGFSGLSLIKGSISIAIKDTKSNKNTDRFFIINNNGLIYPLSVTNPILKQTNDLEAICKDPINKNEFWAIESRSNINGNPGRLFHIKVDNKLSAVSLLSIYKISTLFSRETKREIEGIACIASTDNKRVFFFGERGGKIDSRISKWYLDNNKQKLVSDNFKIDLNAEYKGINNNILKKYQDWRFISDIALKEISSSRFIVYGASTLDYDKDFGPFKSKINKLGIIDNETFYPNFSEINADSYYDNQKIEGITYNQLTDEIIWVSDNEKLPGTTGTFLLPHSKQSQLINMQ